MAASLLRQEGYACVREIGKGAFGSAYHVKKDGSDLVCKTIDLTTATEKEKRAALKEALLLTKFNNPFVVRYVDHFMASGWLMIVQEFCEGGDLQVRISQRSNSRTPFDTTDITKWFTHALLGLKYLHDKHILHRDLKSSNFFLKNGDLKIGDFGIAKVLSNTRCFAKTAIGTPYYLSPEVVRGETYSWPSDMWAMGCFLFELLCLKPPFEGRAMKDLMHKISRGPMPRWPSHHPLSPIGEELLQREQRKRPKPRDVMQRPVIQEEIRRIKQVADDKIDRANIDDDCLAAVVADRENRKIVPPRAPDALPVVSYKVGDEVEYWSETHQEWLRTHIVAVNAQGSIQISIKANSWIPQNVQNKRVRALKLPPSPARGARQPRGNNINEPVVARHSRNASPALRNASPSVHPTPRNHDPTPRIQDPTPRIHDPAPRRDASPNLPSRPSSRRNSPSVKPAWKADALPPTKPPMLPKCYGPPMAPRAYDLPPPAHDRPDSPWQRQSPRLRSPGSARRLGDIAMRSPSPLGRPAGVRHESPFSRHASPFRL